MRIVSNLSNKIEKKIKINEFQNFKIGVKVIILGYPDSWSSGLNDNCPSRIKYPYYCTIKEMEYHEDGFGNIFCYSMTDGKYGFEINSLFQKNLIILDKKEERKQKIKKLNEKM